jgi:hypothetical protein
MKLVSCYASPRYFAMALAKYRKKIKIDLRISLNDF